MSANLGEVISVIRNQAQLYGVDPDLAVAIAYVESHYRPLVARFEPDWKYFTGIEAFAIRNGITSTTEKTLQATSWGVLQCMGSVARELGFAGMLTELCDVSRGAEYGCKKLAELTKRYENEDAIIAAYNAGSPRRVGGQYVNQGYVDKVKVRLGVLRSIN